MKIFSTIRHRLSEEAFQILSVLSGLIVMMIVFGVFSENFFTTNNLLTIALQTAIIAIIAVGQTCVLVTGGIDLSIGSNIAIAGVVSTMSIQAGVPIAPALALGLLAALLVGVLNGALIVYGDLPPFVVTLGTMSVVRGIALTITNGIPVTGLPKEFNIIGNEKILQIPIPVIITLVVIVIFWFVLSKTSSGLRIYAVGSNVEAARLSGVNVKRSTIIAYASSGLLAGLAGIILASRIASGQPSAGNGYELFAVAASVIGGTSLAGGEGTIIGTLIGAYVIGVLQNGLNLLNISAFTQQILIGVVIILAVFADRIKRK